MSLPIDDLIGRLGADLRPVRRLRPPAWRAAAWLGGIAAAGLVLASVARLEAIGHRLAAEPDMRMAAFGAFATTVLAAVATFQLSVPDRRSSWALLPLPGVLLWLGATGAGCIRPESIVDLHAATGRDTTDCFTFIVGLSIPLSAVTLVMVRRAFCLRPGLTAAIAGLAVAAGAATLLTLFHPYDASLVDLGVHALAVGIVVAVNARLGGRLLTPSSTPR